MIGEQLRILRRSVSPPMSQRELARRVGVHYMTVNQIELGRSVSLDTAAKMAAVLGWRLVVKLEKVEE
jgi:DNA-binding XRE family transcriptional regulator